MARKKLLRGRNDDGDDDNKSENLKKEYDNGCIKSVFYMLLLAFPVPLNQSSRVYNTFHLAQLFFFNRGNLIIGSRNKIADVIYCSDINEPFLINRIYCLRTSGLEWLFTLLLPEMLTYCFFFFFLASRMFEW